MKVKRQAEGETTISLAIEASETELASIHKAVVRKLGRNVRIPGFRAGKAPMGIIEKNLDQALLQSDFLDAALTELYSAAVREGGLRPAARPEVSLTKFVPFKTLEFAAKVEVIGRVMLGDYTKLKSKRAVVAVEPTDVDKVIENLRLRAAAKQDVDRASKTSDQVWIDFDGSDDKGKPVAGANGKEYPLSLGSNTFIPGFEANIVGMKADEEKTFDLSFPKDYRIATLAGRKVSFKVKVTKVQEVTLPKLDAAFVASVSPLKTVAELKADILAGLQDQKKQEAEDDYRAALIRELSDKSTVAIPSVLIDEQVEASISEVKQNLAYRGVTWQDFLVQEGKTEDQIKTEYRLPAEQRVKAGLVLGEVAELEKVSVSDSELTEQLAALKTRYTDPAMQVELAKPDALRSVADRLMTQKTIDLLVSKNY